jgi:undecaprenyl pyrophosphate synthase
LRFAKVARPSEKNVMIRKITDFAGLERKNFNSVKPAQQQIQEKRKLKLNRLWQYIPKIKEITITGRILILFRL